MKKIFIVCNSYPYFKGEAYFESEVDFLSRAFNEVTIFSVVAGKKEKMTRFPPSNINIVPLNCPKRFLLNLIKGLFIKEIRFKTSRVNLKKFLLKTYMKGRKKSISEAIIKYIKNEKIECANSLFYSYWLSFAPATLDVVDYLKKHNTHNINCISRAHGYDLFWERMPYQYAPFQKKAIELLDGVYSVSEYGMTYLSEKYPEYKNKIFLNRLGTFDHGISNNFKEGKYNIFVTCSDNRPVKRLDLFAKCFSKYVRTFDSDSSWKAIGINGSEETILNNLKDVKNNVIFLGSLANRDVLKKYKEENINYFINVSSSEGLPVSIMEALSFGIPIIATDVGGTSELVDEGTGFLLSANPSEEEIVSTLKKAANLKEKEYLNLRYNARKKWDSLVNAGKNYLNWIDVLNSYENIN